MTTETANALRAAKALIDTPDKWCKRDACKTTEDGVVQFCVVGAVAENWSTNTTLPALIRALPGRRTKIVRYNDDPRTTHADIMALFDRAIQAEEEAL